VQDPTPTERAAWLAALGDEDVHRRLLAEVACLHDVEQRPAGAPVALSGWVRVAAWNVLRGHRPAALATALRTSAAADLCLLSELDAGMARTQNLDTTAAVARDLGAGYAYGVEFVELGLGSEDERRLAAGTDNARGLHGNAIVSAAPIEDPAVVRLPGRGLGWFAAESSQPRVGGRMAVVATVRIDDVDVVVASTHLENTTTAEHRAEQMEVLLQAIDDRADNRPSIVGGDFNTLGATMAELIDRHTVRAFRADEPTRFTWPVRHEPLFDVARGHGYSWTDANVAAPTTEHDGRGRPDHVPIRLDWLLVRGLVARRPAVVPAGALSDHQMVTVAVRRA
jgi:endonuclease/exonuclease/phosphatase family metal-dependent hydrolase